MKFNTALKNSASAQDKNLEPIHTPVLLDQAIASLEIKANGVYIDCTLGDGGHSYEIYKKLGLGGVLISIDQDEEAIAFVESKYKNFARTLKINQPEEDNQRSQENGSFNRKGGEPLWLLVHDNFANIKKIAKAVLEKIARQDKDNLKVDGILADIGISSRQLDVEKRGFSYQEDEQELDMRMDQRLGVKAKDLLMVLSEKQLTNLFLEYGEERFARSIAKAIKENDTEINTVGDLSGIIHKALPIKYSKTQEKSPARRVFQALRIAVNDELNSLKKLLEDGYELLETEGKIVGISFHSLEDRIVKNFIIEKMKASEKENITSRKDYLNFIVPTEEEIRRNPRASSAKMRTIKKQLTIVN